MFYFFPYKYYFNILKNPNYVLYLIILIRNLFLLHDRDDPNDKLTDIEIECVNYDIKLLLCFKYEEVSSYLRTFVNIHDKSD